MRKFWVFAILVCLFSCSTFMKKKGGPPELKSYTYEEVKKQIDDILSASVGKGKAGILFENVKTGEILFSQNENEFFRPASTNKLLTTSTALNTLGLNYKYQTKLLTNGKVKDDTLFGDLIILGSGDPSFSPRFTRDKNDMTIILKDWADILLSKNIKNIKGNIIGDDDYFDDEYFLDSWYGGERAEWFSTEVSGLSFNDNCIDLFFTGGKTPDEPPSVKFLPNTKYVEIINKAKTVENNAKDVYFDREDKSNVITATGEVQAGKLKKAWATVYNPTLFCATVLKETLQEKGIAVEGEAKDIDDIADKAPYKNNLETITFYESPVLPELIMVVNRISHNFYAEQIYRTLGKVLKNEGSFKASAEAVQDFLKKNNIYKEGHAMVDGSGLSKFNQVSPRIFNDLLKYMYKSESWKILLDSLPQGGVRGTLSSRFKNSEREKFLGKNVFGKTGYIRKTVTLVGFITEDNGNNMVFSCLLNDYDCDNQGARDAIDKIVCLLSEYNIMKNKVK